MKRITRVLEILNTHITALEDEVKWYEEKNMEWQKKYEVDTRQLRDKIYALDTQRKATRIVENLKLRDELAEYKTVARDFVEINYPDHICRMRFKVLLKDGE